MELGFAGRMLAGLAVIVVVLFALQVVARAGWSNRLTGNDRRLMTMIETLALPGAASLHAVKIGERYYVFGRSGGHVANLCEIPPADVQAWRDAHDRDAARPAALAQLAATLRWPRA